MVTDNKKKKRKLVSVRTKPKQRQKAQHPPDAYDEDFLDRIKDFHWPRHRSGPIITVGWEWRYEFNYTSDGVFNVHHCGDPLFSKPCYDLVAPDTNFSALFCGWGDFVKVGVDLGGTPPAKSGPFVNGGPPTSAFAISGGPFADENVSLPPHVYASQAWVQPMEAGAQFAPFFVPSIPEHPEFGGSFVHTGVGAVSATQSLWGKPLKDFGVGYWTTQSGADADDASPICPSPGSFANGWITDLLDVAALGGSITANLTGAKNVILKPPGVVGVPTKKPIPYELYKSTITYSINAHNSVFPGPSGVIDFNLKYKVKGSPTPLT